MMEDFKETIQQAMEHSSLLLPPSILAILSLSEVLLHPDRINSIILEGTYDLSKYYRNKPDYSKFCGRLRIIFTIFYIDWFGVFPYLNFKNQCASYIIIIELNIGLAGVLS